MEKENRKENKTANRPPVVAVMGHIDHGKSTLLDYIRKTNVVEKEAGGITQAISAYEVTHKDEEGEERKITFLDTPGHESFSKMRERGAQAADIAILIVAADDGVKPQTVETINTILASGIPYLVAINKIDKPGANVEKTKQELAENEVYLENYGGKIPCAEISAKTGEGVDDLLSLINLMAMMENFTGDPDKNASGFVIEADMDPRRGIEATLVIKNGTLGKGMYAVALGSTCSTNIMENFLGKQIQEASFSSPIRLVGWNKVPAVGAEFQSFANKKEAEKFAQETEKNRTSAQDDKLKEETATGGETQGESESVVKKIIPIILKADTLGSIEAIEKEIGRMGRDGAEFRIVQSGVGPISEFDVKTISSPEETLVLGFNVKTDKSALEISQQKGIVITFFDIIYKLTEWLEEELKKREPKTEIEETLGKAKVLKVFSKTRDKQVLGGKVLEGKITADGNAKILRRDFEIGRGRAVNLEKNRTKTTTALEGEEFGLMLEAKPEVATGDILEFFTTKIG